MQHWTEIYKTERRPINSGLHRTSRTIENMRNKRLTECSAWTLSNLTDWMWINYRVLSKRKGGSLLLPMLFEIDRRDESGLLPDTVLGRMYRIAWPCYNLFSTEHNQGVHASIDCQRRSRQGCVYMRPRPISVYTNALWIEKISRDVSTRMRHLN